MDKNDKKKTSVGESIVPDGGWGWVVVFSSFLIHFIMDGITYSMGQTFLEPMRNKLGLDRASVSTIFSILPAVTLGAGLGFSLMYLPAIVSVGLYFEKRRTFAMGIAVCGSGVGTMALAFITNGIVNIRLWLSYENALLLESAIIMISLLCGFLMLPLPQEPSEQRRLERKMRKEDQQKQNEELLIVQNGSTTSKNNPAEVVIIEKSPKKSFFHEIIEQIDFKLLKNLAFTLFVGSNFLASLGFNVIYNYADDLANDSNVQKDYRSYIVMSIGLSNIFGRIIIGYFGDRKSARKFFQYEKLTLTKSFVFFLGYASTFGFFSGGYVTLTAIVLVDIVGINKLSDAFGVLLLFVGIATAIGTPIVGGMRDAFAHFARPFLWPYFIFGGFTILSGAILFAIPLLQRKKSSDEQVEMGCNNIFPEKDLTFEEQQQKV
ncbi:unnamed protein product [Rotaria sp. Silwood2]|nr:unnamed protein product [Rotaria sp. Silwood2]CAF4147621.1 unnamed protein product [Rotaria sp. Silwood2]